MKSAVKLHPYIYNLLIEKDFDEFGAVHLRDALLKITDEYADVTEARKFVHRQLLRLEALGFVHKIENSGGRSRNVYKKTESFHSTTFVPRKLPKNSRLVAIPEKVTPPVSEVDLFLVDLMKEKVVHEAKLAVILSEIEEYQSLMERFPSRKRCFMDLYLQAKNQSAALLGRVAALSKVLGQHNNEHCVC
ncbi:hypothetical protein EC843_108132 [Buttiauxella sp. JUb87]|jgi:hypothetical protein|uniref:hypothetical protein n=1 Tax=Buttiauxella sp. JUb87 TaxID=2485129 RepID=UPI0010619AEA|nr:hypothetical protein [Buttiauxella sp. JUb87]TDN49452.1 hypothetical protein EC843_108132 [Buttiauxella sp. JUb87]